MTSIFTCVLNTVLIKLLLIFCTLAKVAIFTTNVDAGNQFSINQKYVCGALNRHFCQTALSGGAYSFSHFQLLGLKSPPMVLLF